MNFAEFAFYYKRQVGDLAKELDINPVYLRMLARNSVRPSKKLAKKIEEVSRGRVTAENARTPPSDMVDLQTYPQISRCGGW